MTLDILAELVGTVHSVTVEVGDQVAAGDQVVVLESMKMEIPVLAESGGTVVAIAVTPGETVHEGDVLVAVDLRR